MIIGHLVESHSFQQISVQTEFFPMSQHLEGDGMVMKSWRENSRNYEAKKRKDTERGVEDEQRTSVPEDQVI